MELHKTILFYSKYSQSSNNLLKLIDTCGVKIQEIIGYRLISVDSKTVRKQLLNNRKITVKHVPCLIKVFNNGTVEQYNYNELQQLIKYTIKLHKEEVLKQRYNSVNDIQVKERVIEQNESSSESEIEEIVIKPKKTKKKPIKKPIKKPKIEKQYKTTVIDSDESTESETDTEKKSNISTIMSTNEKPSASKQKSDDLMHTAMEMQKERETYEDTNNKKPMSRMGPV